MAFHSFDPHIVVANETDTVTYANLFSFVCSSCVKQLWAVTGFGTGRVGSV